MTTERDRARIIDALLGLLAERPFGEVGLTAIADRAGVSLAELRAAYDGRLAILADFTRRIDVAVLEAAGETTEESERQRLLDLFALRFRKLRPHRAALRRLADDAAEDFVLMARLHRQTVLAMRWMLAAAGIERGSLAALVRCETLAFAWTSALRVWLAGEEPDEAEALATLGRSLAESEAALGTGEQLGQLIGPFLRLLRQRWGGKA